MPSKLPEGEGKRVPLNMRTTQDLRLKLDAAAEATGRSLAQEIEFRLEQSLSNDLLMRILVGGGIQGEMLTRLAEVVTKAKNTCNNLGFDEAKTREVIAAACLRVVSVYCWTGGNLPQSGYVGVHGKHVPVSQRSTSDIGVETADNAMIWGGDQALEDLEVVVSDRWSGGGDKSEMKAKLTKQGNAPGTTPLKDIFGGR